MIRLCAFADEAGSSLGEQISALRENGISLIEVRGIDGKNVSQFTTEEAICYARQLRENGITVWSIGSPIGKVPLADAKAHMHTVRRICELARIFETKRIRIFSFFEASGCEREVIDALRQMADIANEYDLLLCHENEKEIFGDVPDRIQTIMDANVKGLRFVFDPANYVQCGISADAALRRFFASTDYFHIKDVIAKTGELVPAGFGDGALPALAELLARSGRDAVLTLEPHLTLFDGYAQIDNSEMKHRFRYTNARESFSAAANALKDVLRAAGFHETEIDKTTKGWCIS